MKSWVQAYLPLSVLLSVLLVDVSAAQQADRFSITGQIRQRTEYSAKDFDADRPNPLFSLLRTRLNVGLTPTDDVQALIQFQDSRTWGGEDASMGRGTLDGSADQMDLHQAYFAINGLFGSDFSAKIGRQEINVGNQRLVGAVGWHNVGRSFDAVRFGYELEKGNLDLFAARLIGNTANPDGENLYGIVGTFPLGNNNNLVAQILMDNRTNAVVGGPDDGENQLQRLTSGAALTGGATGLEYELEAYYQMGDQFEAATGKLGAIGAYLVSARVGYLVRPENSLKVGALVTLVSGDDDATDGDIKNFDTLFATNHKYYGFMDYFIGAGSFARGLQDVGVSLSMKPNEKTSLALDLHHFTAPQMQAGLSTTLGQEVDFTLGYAYNKAVSVSAGVSAFLPGDDFGGSDTAFWGYLSTSVTF